ncbi:Der GTPase-activating protein YihI [Idiomarina sp.]|uniref:Der GTPase-activating protein YihI n=1 Tax=Idiomarina sp. TaxID=1874361 RepID=UPI002618EDF0|nr:Der GTPase-activating protein YihI [Idiomarina sp.]
MTRRKKTRKTGPLAPSKQPKDKRPSEVSTKGKKKGKGLRPGQRHLEHQKAGVAQSKSTDEKDPRIGSRRKIELVMTPDQELQQLQNDERLQRLVERFEEGETLSADDQRYLDEKSERYETLVSKLGYELDDDWDDEEY